jgi:translation initiation factor 3 subunit C
MAQPQSKGRFWGADDDESESEDNSSGSESSGGDVNAKEATKAGTGAGGRAAKWGQESESESEDENRVARSAKDRHWDAMRQIIKGIENDLKINSWVSLQESE